MREIMLIIHFIGLAMGLGTSLGFMFLGIASTKMETQDALKFQLNSLVLSRMGQIGLVLLIVSGLFLMEPHWDILPDTPLLITKLVLVLILTALIIVISFIAGNAKKGDAAMHLKKIAPLGRFTLLISLIIIILAVYIFH